MELRILSNNALQINDARLTWCNFAGEKFGKGGERTFAVIIPSQEQADELREAGYNVVIKPPREEGDSPFMVLKVKVKFNSFGPNVYLQSGSNMRKLDEESVDILDKIRIASADLDISPYDSTVRGVDYRSAYVRSMKVVQRIEDRFAEEYDSYCN